MSMRDRFRSVQARLTAWFVLAMTLFIVLFSAALLFVLARTIEQRLDAAQVDACHAFVRAVRGEHAERDARNLPIETVVRQEASEFVFRDGEIAVFSIEGQLLASSRGSQITPLTALRIDRLRGIAIASKQERRFETLEVGDDSYRLFAMPFVASGRPLVVLTSRHRNEQDVLRSVALLLSIGAPLWIAISGIAGWHLVKRSLAPVASMSAEAAAIGSTDVSKRLRVVDAGSELGLLATTFNALLDRLASTIEQQRRFMADASHELRTPITIIRGEADVALTRTRTSEELRDALTIIQKESEQLTSIVDDLFLLVRVDAKQRMLLPNRFYLDELLADTARNVRSLAAAKEITLEVETPREVSFDGDEQLLARLVRNLLDNAVKYTPRGGRVAISLACDAAQCTISVSDSAMPIAIEERDQIFERFHRGADHEGEGAGLGLAIARSIAELHGGRLELDPHVSGGNTFRVHLPRR